MPICAAVSERMHEIIELTYYTSEQHVESPESCMKRDTRDTEIVIEFLKPLEPFGEHGALRNITAGVTAISNVNVDTSENVGLAVLKDMEGTSLYSYTFRKKDKCVTMSKQALKLDGETVHIDQGILFSATIHHCW